MKSEIQLIKYDEDKFKGNIFELKIGDVFYDKQWNYKHYVVVLLLDEEMPQIVSKYFGRHKQWWHYKIEPLHYFNLAYNGGLYAKNRFQQEDIRT